MPTIDSCQLTTKDYTILEVMRERHPGRGETLLGNPSTGRFRARS